MATLPRTTPRKAVANDGSTDLQQIKQALELLIAQQAELAKRVERLWIKVM